MPKEIKLYTKVCAKCIWSDKLNALENYAVKKGAKLKTIRTTYSPELHKEATELYGSADYTAFVYERGKAKDFVSWTGQTKAKPVKKTKAKSKSKKK